jgi:hypothetical protein
MMYRPPSTTWSPYLPAPITSEEGPLPEAKRGIWPGRYAKVTAFVLIAMVVVAIVAAAVGPLVAAQISPASAPSNWTKAYDSSLQNTTDWTGDGGCYNGPNGLDVSAVTGNNGFDMCTYAPSTTADLVSQGFQLNLTLSPESQLQSPLTPMVQVGDGNGNGLTVAFDDTGEYAICEDSNSDCSTCLPSNLGSTCNGSVLASDSTVAWHTDSYVANTLAFRYQVNSDGGDTISVFANGQEVASSATSVSLGSGFSIAIGSGDGGEALYTGATLYTNGSASYTASS